MDMLLMIVAFGAIMYFLMIRPQQKRAKEHQALINSIEAGTRVLLTSGIFATVVHVGERQLIVELAPGTEITVLKGNVARVVGDADEEFVFSDELSEDDVDEVQGEAEVADLDRFDEIAANFDRDDAPQAPADDVAATPEDDTNSK